MAVRFGQFFQRLYYRLVGGDRLAGCLEPHRPVFVPGRCVYDGGFVIGNVIFGFFFSFSQFAYAIIYRFLAQTPVNYLQTRESYSLTTRRKRLSRDRFVRDGFNYF